MNLTDLNGIGKARLLNFKKIGIESLDDLLHYYPRAYDDFSQVTPINKIKPGNVSIKVNIRQVKGRYSRRRLHITEAIASDETGSVRLIWFNQPYRAASIKSDAQYFVSGNFELSANRLSIINPSIELVSDMPINSARILAVYKETKGLDSRQIRQTISQVLSKDFKQNETLPSWLIREYSLLSLTEAIKSIHSPKTSEDIKEAKRRLGFEEAFEAILASKLNKLDNKHQKSHKVSFKEGLAKNFVKNLPFQLTDAQRLTVWKIYQDMESAEPMNRLVEGDVGSGKTVVATMAALMVVADKKQVAFMAPTELLARQLAQNIYDLLKPLQLERQVCLLVGSMTPKQKTQASDSIKKGKAKVIIGTHTLIQSNIDMHDLGLIVIDEQHRFGVEQRKALMKKAGHMPHVLTLSATPIPRSLALTLFGELDISLLKEKPRGRQLTVTKIVNINARNCLFASIAKQISEGSQMFVVCPSINATDLIDIKSIEEVYEELKKSPLNKFKIKILHGKLKSEEKNSIMKDFSEHKIDILVTTTVIEVGIDIPNANIMLIYNPERFGLAQLHQLRGRVGRSSVQGYFYMLADDKSLNLRRLAALESLNDGFKLAELDLDIRGPGAIYGTLQHGAIDLRVINLTDTRLINEAAQAADDFIKKAEKMVKYKKLAENVNKIRAVTNLN